MTDPDDLLPLDKAQHFLQLLWRLNHAIESCSKQMATRLGITFQQRTVLRLVGRFSGVSAGRLAETLHVDRGTLSATLGRLEARGLLERRQDKEDRRRVRLYLTPKGRALDVPETGTVESAAKRALAEVSGANVRATERVIATLVQQLEKTFKPAENMSARDSTARKGTAARKRVANNRTPSERA